MKNLLCVSAFLWLIYAVLSVTSVRTASAVIFADVTARAGIKFVHTSGAFGKKYLPETLGSGVVVLDLDGDG